MQKIAALQRQLTNATPVDVPASVTKLFATVQDVLNSALGTEIKSTSEISAEMAFTGVGNDGATRAPKARRLVIPARAEFEDGSYRFDLVVDVVFDTVSSRVGVLSGKLFKPGSITSNDFQNVRLDRRDPASATVFSTLRTSQNALVRAFLDELYIKGRFSDPGDPKSPSSVNSCLELWNVLGGLLTKRDQAGMYYSFLLANSSRLSKSKDGDACAVEEPMASEMKRWGLTPPPVLKAQAAPQTK